MVETKEKLISQLNELDFSQTSKQLDALKQLIFDADTSNHAKIAFIKEELLAQRYTINSDRIVDGLLTSSAIIQEDALETTPEEA